MIDTSRMGSSSFTLRFSSKYMAIEIELEMIEKFLFLVLKDFCW